ncbi:MAG: lysophospholipid acyltransferase family protein [Ignavibacteria bacterium]|nr:lysophospholipid acyltransferase family protein [Ignavibacteria bacterium]
MMQLLASILLRILASTWRIRIEGNLPKNPCLVAFWHGEMLPVWYAMRGKGPTALVSESRDGSYLARLLTDWGFHVVRGSSSKGGSEALQEVVAELSQHIVLMTPDGPRGPIHECKPGVVVAAQRAQVPVVLVRAFASRAVVFDKSWDRFMVPALFAHITIHVSHEIRVDSELDRDRVNKKIEDIQHQLNSLGSIVC